jgi:hypothetical protein
MPFPFYPQQIPHIPIRAETLTAVVGKPANNCLRYGRAYDLHLIRTWLKFLKYSLKINMRKKHKSQLLTSCAGCIMSITAYSNTKLEKITNVSCMLNIHYTLLFSSHTEHIIEGTSPHLHTCNICHTPLLHSHI